MRVRAIAALAGLAFSTIISRPAPALAADDVTLAVILPLSGVYARSGELELAGIKLAVQEINDGGGLRALNGRKIAIEVKDAGTSVESAVLAARQVLGGDTKISGGIGAWLSSFTLGVSEVSERRRIPWLTVSSSDQVSKRGFKYLYQTVAPSSVWAESGLSYLKGLAEAQGCPIRTVAIVGDNSASPTAFFNAVRTDTAKKFGWTITVDTTWTPPLADGTAIAQRLEAAKPDLILFGATNFPDAVQVLSKAAEFGVKTGNYVGNGSWLVMPEYVQSVGAKNLEGIFDISGVHPLKGYEAIEARFKQATHEPFLQQEGLAGYYHVWIFKEAIEQAKSDDPTAINNAIKALDLSQGPAAAASPTGHVRFDAQGRLADAIPVMVQWQSGLPVSVYPQDRARETGHYQCSR